ncbi:MAG TPA: YfhO family protein [Chitinophagales bacterium]|nr:YfhO family protein [Chitinophagales bacterium]
MSTKKEKKPAPAQTPKPKLISAPVKNPLFEKHAFAVAVGLTSLIAFIIFKDYLLMKNVYLFKDIGSDTLNASYPTMCMYATYLQQYAFPSWTFSYGMGQNILPFFLRDPFDLFIYYSGKDHIPYLLAWKEFAKVVLTGMIFFSYLRLVVKDGFTCVVGTLLFSFSGFMILGSGWYLFSFEAFNLALLILAFEKLFLQGKWILFPIAILSVGISQPFNLYVYGIFLGIYALMRFFEQEETFSSKPLLLLFGKMGGYAALGLLISSVFLVPNIIQLLESPRGSGASSYANKLQSTSIFHLIDAQQLKTAFSRIFSNDLMGSGINFKGWTNYLEAPLLYCGILTLILVPLSFTLFEKRKRKIYLLFLAVWILPIALPYLRYTFWFFTGDYYRVFSLCVAIALIYPAVQALKLLNTEMRKVNVVVSAFAALCLLIAVSTTTITEIKSKPLFFLAVLLIILYSLLIIFLARQKDKSTLQYVLLILLCIEFSYQGYTTTSNRKVVSIAELKSRDGYNDYTVDAVSFLKTKDHGFFRIDKDYPSTPAMHASINDGMAQDYFGTTAYNSFNQINYIHFLGDCGVIDASDETLTRWAPGVRGHFLLEDICSVKYLLLKNAIQPGMKFKFDSLARFGDVNVLENKFSLPLGFAYDHYMLQSDFKKVGKNYLDVALLIAFLIPDSMQNYFVDLQRVQGIDSTKSFNNDLYTAAIDSLRKDTMVISSFQQTHIAGKISCAKKELLFLSIPSDKGWSASVNGNAQKIFIVDGGLIGLLLDKGENTIELIYTNRYFITSLICSLAGCVLFLILLFVSAYFKRARLAGS